MFVLLTGLSIWQAKADAVQVATRIGEDLCFSLAVHARQAFDSADFVAEGLKRSIQDKNYGDSEELLAGYSGLVEHELLRSRQLSFNGLNLILVVNAQGRLVNTSATYPPPETFFADREAFSAMRSESFEPHISAPVHNRIDGRWSIYVSRRLVDTTGKFMGAVIVGISPTYFADFYSALRLDRAAPRKNVSAMTLLRNDRIVVSRAPFDESVPGRQMSAAGAYAAVSATARAQPSSAPFEPWDAAPAKAARVMLLHKSVPGYPLIVALAMSDDLYLEQWQDRAVAVSLLASVAVLLLASTFFTLVKVLRRRERYLQEVETLRLNAEAASSAKTSFLATVSHEVRTPLNGILGTADLLARSGLTPRQQELAGTLLTSGRTLLAIINDILDLTKIEANELQLHVAPFSLRAMVNDVLGLFTSAALSKGLRLSMHIDADVPTYMMGDAQRIGQVVGNLVSNAIKFTDRGEVLVCVSVASLAERGPVVRLEVLDQGVGIPEAARARIFQPFVQADGSIARRFGGTGLGLTICRRLVSMMQGQIDFAPRAAGVGTRFWVDIPLAAYTGPMPVEPSHLERSDWTFTDGGASAPPATSKTSELPRSGVCHVLVVEDNAINAMVVEAQLQRLGCSCHLASDGEEALQRLSSGEEYHLVLMDCMLPGMTGLEVTRQWRALEEANGLPRLPIIALTANALASNLEETRAAGMDDFLTKPCTLDRLEATVTRWRTRQTCASLPPQK